MRRFYSLAGLVSWCSVAVLSAADHPPKSPVKEAAAPERTNYLGWVDSYALAGSVIRTIIVPAVGGRILNYSLNGENVLFEGAGHELAEVRGYQCDIGPELRGIPPHDRLWTGPYEAETLEDQGLGLKSSPDPKLGLALEKEIIIDPESGDLGITQRMRNVSSNDTSYCFWDRTTCKGGGFAFFPLKKKSRFPARWSLRKASGPNPGYEGVKPQSGNVKIMNGVLVAKCEGEATRLGADSDAGWIAYVRGRWLFVKYFPYSGKGRYTDGGNSVELYFDQQVAELQPLSPEVKLKAGESYDFPEKWTLIELDSKVTSFVEARGLVEKVPPSPF